MLWNDTLKTGMPKIDEQHKELFRQIDILLDRDQADRIPATIQFLANYVVKHFIDEQTLQTSVRYPKAEQHKKLHADFTARFKDLKKRFEASGDNIKFDMVTEINRVVLGWLKEHILVHDKEFADYYKKFQQARRVKAG